ncbi:penicillin acylase [Secundilactobacillus pentosiphilus]|uniref:Penicillin acylase n=1 Tax=Secundilactobacillus pentosiphilus TaxID=1714682 RepID=A0A1Z5IY35_9LACO|nr:linear amide C-N hydrolase [Secundilactobacillus pentosiphilus]GAX06720.1 penicillin acylase [Secundilactobacillus pentosiphilus]
MACTGIELISKQQRPYWGRTQDFEQHFEYAGVKVPKGYLWRAAATPFESQLNVMGIVWAKDIHQAPVLLDGINDYGICGGSFYFDHFYRYVDTETIEASGKVAVRGEELCTWILTHYKSLDDIKNNLGNDIGITNEVGYMMGMSVPQHCVFIDQEGRSIVVEPSKPNGFRIFDNPLGVMTNAPTFDWHLNNLKTWLERITNRSYTFDDGEPIEQIGLDESTSGLVGLPADYKPESRFLRAAVNKLMSVEVDDEETLNQIFQLLSAVNTPKGSLRIHGEGETLVAWTQYTAGYDIQKKQLYAFTYDNQNLRMLEFGDPADWASEMAYFSFISKPKAQPFTPQNEWEPGENTI